MSFTWQNRQKILISSTRCCVLQKNCLVLVVLAAVLFGTLASEMQVYDLLLVLSWSPRILECFKLWIHKSSSRYIFRKSYDSAGTKPSEIPRVCFPMNRLIPSI